MFDSYIEVLVKKQPKPWYAFVKGLFIFATVFVLVFLGILQKSILFMALGALLGVASYFVFQEMDLEYEYLYVNGELSIDKIMGKSSRSKVGAYSMENLEIMAPKGSWHIGDMEKQKSNVIDCSSRSEEATVYVAYFRDSKGLCKVVFEPTADMVNAMKSSSPRKVFSE